MRRCRSSSPPASRRARRRAPSWGFPATRPGRGWGSSTTTTTSGGCYPRPQGVRVASNDAVRADAGGAIVAQAAEGEEDAEPRPDEGREDETVRYINPDTGETRQYPARLAPRKPDGWLDMRDLPDPNKPEFAEPLGGTPIGTVAEAVAPGGVLPGNADKLGAQRAMEPSAIRI